MDLNKNKFTCTIKKYYDKILIYRIYCTLDHKFMNYL